MPTFHQANPDAPTLCLGPTTTRGIAVRKVGNVTVLDLTYPLTMDQSVEAFQGRIWELLDAGAKDLAINLAKVPYIDSTGIGALLAVHNSIQGAGGKCRFFAAQEHVRHMLRRVQLDKVFKIYDDEAAAVSSS